MAVRTLIRNARLVDDHRGPADAHLVISDGRIVGIGRGDAEGAFDHVVDADGGIVAPGFIDLHIHGAGGSDSLDGDRAAMETISRTLARQGTTAFLATTFAQPERNHAHLRGIAECAGTDLGGAHLLGIHIEGPFINLKRKGGILPEVIYDPTPAALDAILDAAGDALRIMTIAPELPGNLDLIRTLDQNGVVPSIGHSDATYEQAMDGFAAGVRHATHLYNASPGLHHRDPGLILAVYENEDITAELIADGVHVGRHMVRFTSRILGPDRIACVTDGILGTGLPEGQYTFNGKPFESKDGAARYLDGGLIGTTLGLGEIFRRFVKWTGMPLPDAVRCVSTNAARSLGLENQKGKVAVGLDADLVILDDDLNVRATIVEGRTVFDDALESSR